MGRSPCKDDTRELKKGPWTPEEDEKLISYINIHGSGSWRALPKAAGLNRCGKSCRLRWTNYLRTDIRRGRFTAEEEDMIIKLHSVLGNKWSRIAAELPGRTDNEIKNHWNTQLKKKLLQMGIDPVTHKQRTDLNLLSNLSQLLTTTQNIDAMMINPLDLNNSLRLQPNIAELAKLQVLQNMFQILNNTSISSSSPPLLSLPNNNVMYSSSSQGLFSQNPNCNDPNQQIVVDNKSSVDIPKLVYNTRLDEDNCSNQQSLSSNTSHESLDENNGLIIRGRNEGNINSTTEGSSAMNGTSGDLLMEGWEKLLDDADSDFWKEFINI